MGEHGRQIAGEGHVHPDVFVEFGRIDVDVDLGGVRGVGLEVAGDPIVEPHPERDEQVGLLDGLVHPRLAVHPHHSHVQGMVRRDRADAEERHGDRYLGALGQFPDLPHRTRYQDAVPGVDDRAARPVDELRGPPQLGFRRLRLGTVTR